MDDLRVLFNYCSEWGPCKNENGEYCIMFGEDSSSCPNFEDPEKVKEYADAIRKMKANNSEPRKPEDIYASYRQHLNNLPEDIEKLVVIFGFEKVRDFLQMYAVFAYMRLTEPYARDLVSFMKEFGYGQV